MTVEIIVLLFYYNICLPNFDIDIQYSFFYQNLTRNQS